VQIEAKEQVNAQDQMIAIVERGTSRPQEPVTPRARWPSTPATSSTPPWGFRVHPARAKEGAREFYRFLTANFRTETEEPLQLFFDGDTMVLEQTMTGTVIGEMLGTPRRGRCHVRHSPRVRLPRRPHQP
jgi:hypothetical protein